MRMPNAPKIWFHYSFPNREGLVTFRVVRHGAYGESTGTHEGNKSRLMRAMCWRDARMALRLFLKEHA